MKSYLFTTETDRGGVMLCDIDDFDDAVEYLCNRFDGVVRVEAGDQRWELPAAQQHSAAEPDAAVAVPVSAASSITTDNDLFG